jgi:nucleoside-diphosphate-sugar epimerase
MTTDRPMTAAAVVAADLDAICANAADELAAMSGHEVLVTGGAGFLGYYLVQAMAEWNRRNAGRPPIRVTVFDNFSRGVPAWLTGLADARAVALVRHDMRDPLPPTAGDFAFVVHAASIASPTYYRRDPIGTMDANVNGLRNLLDAFLRRKQAGSRRSGFCSSAAARSTATRTRPTSRPGRTTAGSSAAPARGRATTRPSGTARRCA